MRLKEMREQAGLTQAELARQSGVNLRSLQDYEQGHKALGSAKGETLLKLSLSLGRSIEDILLEDMPDSSQKDLRQELLTRRMSAHERGLRNRRDEIVHFPIVIDVSKLLSRAGVSLENAEHNYSRIGLDDCYLDACCYNLQQSIEFSLKFLVEMTGQQYAEDHDIRANMNILNRVNYHIANEKKLRNMASTLYSWETESRYRDSFTALIEEVEEAFIYARELFLEACGKVT